MGPRNRIQSRRTLRRWDSHWARERMGAPPGPISRGGKSGAPAGSLESGRCTSSSPWYLPGPGAAGFRRPGQPGQDRRGRRHKPPARNPAARPARCLSSIHCGTFLPPGTQIIVVLRRGVVSPTGSTAGFALVLATPWERGRPARTRPGKAMPSSPPRSIRNRSVPDLLCNGCFRFVPVYGPRVSQNGSRKLRTALPNCTALYR